VTRGQRERPPSATVSDADTGSQGDTLLSDPAPLAITAADRVTAYRGGVPVLTCRHTGAPVAWPWTRQGLPPPAPSGRAAVPGGGCKADGQGAL
jgi:hypothetical protein